MPRYDTPVRDWDVSLPMKPTNLRTPSRKMLDGSGRYEKAIRTLQQGVMLFSRKKKNGSRLASARTITAGGVATQRKNKIRNCGDMWPPMPIR